MGYRVNMGIQILYDSDILEQYDLLSKIISRLACIVLIKVMFRSRAL